MTLPLDCPRGRLASSLLAGSQFQRGSVISTFLSTEVLFISTGVYFIM
jgi:hypothetical protein